MKTWIIDGHNVLHAWRDLSALLRGDPTAATAQRELVHRAHLLHDFGGAAVEVVFDSRHEKTLSDKWREKQRAHGVQVLYGAADTQADSVIEQRVVVHPEPERCRVVSNDRMIRQAIEAAGAEPVAVDDFIREIAQLEERQTRAVTRLNRQSDADFGNRLQF